MSVASTSRWNPGASLPWMALAACLVLLAASLLLHDTLFHRRPEAASSSTSSSSESEPPASGASPAMATTVTLPEGKWKAAGIRTEPARVTALASEVGVAGRIEANIDRRVDIRPRASGVIREVRATLGQTVKAGDVLVVLDSSDIGTARLNLKGRQLELATARSEAVWKDRVAANVARLIPELRQGVPAAKIEKDYATRSLGSDRALLLQAYSEYEIASHEAEKTTDLHKEKIIGEHPVFLAIHSREGSRAKLEAVMEQVQFDAAHEKALADQKVRLAEAAVIDAAQRLRILGVSADIPDLLARAGDTLPAPADDVTAYQVVAPFDGTIIARSAVPSQKAEVNDVLFTLADLSDVWVMANIPESDLAVLPALRGGKIRLSTTAYPGRTFDARLLSVGSSVDPATRTVPLLAETANPDGLLKLGMFARIVLDTPTREDALTVPTSAVVEIEGRSGVFVPAGKGGRTFALRPVKLGRESGGRQVVVSGLDKGEPVVSAGTFYLKSELILQNQAEED